MGFGKFFTEARLHLSAGPLGSQTIPHRIGRQRRRKEYRSTVLLLRRSASLSYGCLGFALAALELRGPAWELHWRAAPVLRFSGPRQGRASKLVCFEGSTGSPLGDPLESLAAPESQGKSVALLRIHPPWPRPIRFTLAADARQPKLQRCSMSSGRGPGGLRHQSRGTSSLRARCIRSSPSLLPGGSTRGFWMVG